MFVKQDGRLGRADIQTMEAQGAQWWGKKIQIFK